MGGGYYHQDVRSARSAIGSTQSSANAFDYNSSAHSGRVDSVHPDLDIKNKLRECLNSPDHPNSTPVVVAMDVTKSRGRDAQLIYEQVPSMMGSLKVSGIVPDPSIMWVAIGDATTDKAPLQVGQFEADRRIDQYLSKIWMEEGGGGTGEESYELAAYYLARKTELDCVRQGRKGFVFFTGDEAPYGEVSSAFVNKYIGGRTRKNVPTAEIFRELQEKYHVFLVFPRKSMEDRIADIDSEIRQRLEAAGGRFRDVDIRASLIWNDRNDLDLHCMTPGGYHIYYGAKRAHCGGELDVDRNVKGETTKPVENIRWAKGDAQPGKYSFWVENYAYHEGSRKSVPFKVELEIDGKIQTFEGKTPADSTGGSSRQPVFEFVYERKGKQQREEHVAYADDVILGKWEQYIPAENILRVQDPASSVEVMLGAMALQSGAMDLFGLEEDLKSRRVAKRRQKDVLSALKEFANRGVFHEVAEDVFD